MIRSSSLRAPKTWILVFLIVCFVVLYFLQDLIYAPPKAGETQSIVLTTLAPEPQVLFGSSGEMKLGSPNNFLKQFPVEDLDSFLMIEDEEDLTPDPSNSDEEMFTVLLFTFKYKRMHMVNALLRHFNGFPNISKVMLIWSNPGDESVQNLTLPTLDYPLRIFATSKDSLNVRFSPLEAIRTTGIFILDDDNFIDHELILYAFRIWKQNPERIVGFKPRGIMWDAASAQWIYDLNPSPGNVSIILPGSAFVHKRYLWLYTYKMPGIIRKWVDEKLNCEDIAMNFLISNISQKAPIPIPNEARIFNPFGPHGGLSDKTSHFELRDECINFFTKVYGRNPLIITNDRQEKKKTFRRRRGRTDSSGKN